MLASVLNDIGARPIAESAFVSHDGDFGDPGVKAALKAVGCRWIFEFPDALRFVERSR